MSGRRSVYAGNLIRLLVLGGWIIGCMWLLGADRYRAFLQPAFQPLLAVALVFLVVLLMAVYSRIEQRGSHAPGLGGRALQAGILLVPLLLAVQSAGTTLGASAFGKRYVGGSVLPRQGPWSFPADGRITLLELERHFDVILGREITTEGAVYRDPELPPGILVIFRFVIVCCAADATPVGALVAWPDADAFEEDSWVRVTGRVSLREMEDGAAIQIDADKVEPIPRPRDVYLSPW